MAGDFQFDQGVFLAVFPDNAVLRIGAGTAEPGVVNGKVFENDGPVIAGMDILFHKHLFFIVGKLLLPVYLQKCVEMSFLKRNANIGIFKKLSYPMPYFLFSFIGLVATGRPLRKNTAFSPRVRVRNLRIGRNNFFPHWQVFLSQR